MLTAAVITTLVVTAPFVLLTGGPCSDAKVARILAALADTLRGLPALRSSDLSRAWETRIDFKRT
jgi:hypothetical protein